MQLNPERRRILMELDVDAVRAEFIARVGAPKRPNAIEASLHKARIMAGRAIPSNLRAQSREWLAREGYEVPGAGPH